MVLATDSNSQRGDRRMSFRMLGAQWRNSWRNSDRTLESRDGGCTKRSDALVDETPRKSVHFPDEIVDRVIELPQIEFTTTFDEVEERWYDIDDYRSFEKDRVLTSFAYVASKRTGATSFDHETYTRRGLETLTDDKLSRRLYGEKRALRKAVKEEERRQKDDNTFPDLAKFRKACLKHSKGAKERAIALAQEDAKFVGRDLQEDCLSPLPRLRQMYSDLGTKQVTKKLA